MTRSAANVARLVLPLIAVIVMSAYQCEGLRTKHMHASMASCPERVANLTSASGGRGHCWGFTKDIPKGWPVPWRCCDFSCPERVSNYTCAPHSREWPNCGRVGCVDNKGWQVHPRCCRISRPPAPTPVPTPRPMNCIDKFEFWSYVSPRCIVRNRPDLPVSDECCLSAPEWCCKLAANPPSRR